MGSDREQDRDDLRAVARGERDALAALYGRYAGRLMRIGLALLGERREAEDLLHDVFVEVWERAGDYDPRRGSVKTWLYVRARSRAIDRLRSPARSRRRSLPAPDSWLTEYVTMEERSDHGRLEEALAALPTGQRDVLLLGYFEGLSHSEIARRLEVPIGTVKSRSSAALMKLRVRLRAEVAQ